MKMRRETNFMSMIVTFQMTILAIVILKLAMLIIAKFYIFFLLLIVMVFQILIS